ncbi:MAG: helix-turn-helix domain-containing protein [Vicinamibacteria bacterium]
MEDDPIQTELAKNEVRRRLPTPSRRRLIRERAGVSQSAIAHALGTAPAAVCRWEAGTRNPGAPLLESYLELLDRLEQVAR